MNLLKNNIILFFCFLFLFTNAQDLNFRVKFHPGITRAEAQNIDIKVSVIINDEIVAERHLNSYPPTLIQPVNNPNNEQIFLKVQVLSPKGWAVTKNPVKYNPYNRKITVRRINDIYYTLKHKADEKTNNGNYTNAITNYETILANKIYSSENQHFEILRNKANALSKSGNYQEALETYLEVSKTVDLKIIGNKRKKVFIKELFNTLLKLGNYNRLKYPSKDFPKVIESEKYFSIRTWNSFLEIFNTIYPEIIDQETIQNNYNLRTLKKQFKVIGNRLGVF